MSSFLVLSALDIASDTCDVCDRTERHCVNVSCSVHIEPRTSNAFVESLPGDEGLFKLGLAGSEAPFGLLQCGCLPAYLLLLACRLHPTSTCRVPADLSAECALLLALTLTYGSLPSMIMYQHDIAYHVSRLVKRPSCWYVHESCEAKWVSVVNTRTVMLRDLDLCSPMARDGGMVWGLRLTQQRQAWSRQRRGAARTCARARSLDCIMASWLSPTSSSCRCSAATCCAARTPASSARFASASRAFRAAASACVSASWTAVAATWSWSS